MDYVLLESFMREEPYAISAIPVTVFKQAHKLNDIVTADMGGEKNVKLVIRGELFELDPKHFSNSNYFFSQSINLIPLTTNMQDTDMSNEIKCLADRYALDSDSSVMTKLMASLSNQQLVTGDMYLVSASYKNEDFHTIAFIDKDDVLEFKGKKLTFNDSDITDTFNPEKVGFALLNSTKSGYLRFVGSAMFTKQTLEPYYSAGQFGAPHKNYRAINPYSEKDVKILAISSPKCFSK